MSQYAMAHHSGIGGSCSSRRTTGGSEVSSSRSIGASGGAGAVSYADPHEWQRMESSHLRELEEARARTAQMEKTMRWWSECTANWREKWSKVRNERNKCRDEAKQLRTKLDNALKDLSSSQKDKQELEAHNEQMRKELERIHLLLLKHAGQWDHQLIEALDGVAMENEDASLVKSEECDTANCKDSADHTVSFSQTATVATSPSRSPTVGSAHGSSRRGSTAGRDEDEATPACPTTTPVDPAPHLRRQSPVGREDEQVLQKQINSLQQKLEEANKALRIERLDKASLEERLERAEEDVAEARGRAEELRAGRQEAVKELLQLQDQHADALALIRADLADEANSREGMDRRVTDLRAQVEKLEVEIASEWSKREKLETEKVLLERENKRLRCDLQEAVERIEAKPSGDVIRLQHELSVKTKEISELRHTCNRLKKALADKSSESCHLSRRTEQYESEVKRLRTRVDQLKLELAVAEDEVDAAMNNIRKQQRTNDELQEQIENLQVQIDQLHARNKLSGLKKLPLKVEECVP